MVSSALTPIFVNYRIFVTMGDLEALPPHWAATLLGKVSRYHCGQVDCCFVLQIVLCLLYCFVFVFCLFQLRLTCSFLPSFCPSISCWLLDVAFPHLSWLLRFSSHSSTSAVLPFLDVGGAPIPRPWRCSNSSASAVLRKPMRPFLVGCWLSFFWSSKTFHSNIVLA